MNTISFIGMILVLTGALVVFIPNKTKPLFYTFGLGGFIILGGLSLLFLSM